MGKTKDLLLLHLAQAEQSLERAKNNAYSDSKMEKYHDQLTQLFKAVKKDFGSTTTVLTDADIYDGPKKHLDFIFKSLEFLDSSTLNQIPYEIVACLNHAMRESLDPADNYIIVTSLINNIDGFSYDPMIAFDNALYNDINTKYGIKFDVRLVQINLPRAFSRDYIAAVVLYHELGHFIDHRFSLMSSLTRTLLTNIAINRISTAELTELQIFFPYLASYISLSHPRPIITPDTSLFQMVLFHFMEYYCDLFAAQYIGEASSYYLTYITHNDSFPSSTHPSTTNRVKTVSDYLTSTPNIVVTLINQALQGIRKITLRKHFKDVPSDDFFNLVPTDIESGDELHGLINVAWRIWIDEREKLGKRLNTNDTLKIYNVINNLVEKSIGNFITVNKWQKAYTKLNPTPVPSPASPLTAAKPDVSIFGCLSNIHIKELLDKQLYIRPLLSKDQIGEVGIDFRLGYDFLVSIQGREAYINASKNEWMDGKAQRNVRQFFQSTRRQIGETFILHPHQTVLAVTLEYVKIPDDCILMLFMRSSYSRLGITISTIAQPGYCGCLSVELTNNNYNPINLAVGARLLQGILYKVTSAATYFNSTGRKYVCQVRPEPSAVINDNDLNILNHMWQDYNNRASSVKP